MDILDWAWEILVRFVRKLGLDLFCDDDFVWDFILFIVIVFYSFIIFYLFSLLIF
jgi:hypothetical protein